MFLILAKVRSTLDCPETIWWTLNERKFQCHQPTFEGFADCGIFETGFYYIHLRVVIEKQIQKTETNPHSSPSAVLICLTIAWNKNYPNGKSKITLLKCQSGIIPFQTDCPGLALRQERNLLNNAAHSKTCEICRMKSLTVTHAAFSPILRLHSPQQIQIHSYQ